PVNKRDTKAMVISKNHKRMKHMTDIKIASCLRLLSVFGSTPQSHSPLCSFSIEPNPSQNPQLRI
ncbi:hypothetical protein, partial [Muribaculum intestinale]|uniref:hypothetical protein n=1 Tax=Muribaculum intestinale TaxID=1796646 RepID=UPI0025A9A5A2